MQIENKLSMSEFMSRHDLIFTEIPHTWYEAPFIGNGFMGATLYFNEDNTEMFINLGHTCVYDNRPTENTRDELIYLIPRLPIGKMSVRFGETITSVDLRLDIYNAEITGDIITSSGKTHIKCLIFSGTDCLMFEHSGTNKVEVCYVPSVAESPRYNAGVINNKTSYEKYGRAKSASTHTLNGMTAHVQPYYCGGGFCVNRIEKNNSIYVTVNQGENIENVLDASFELLECSYKNKNELYNEHISWWHDFYSKSFISLENRVFESFIYIQLYKLASASRENGKPFDTCGPWLTDTTTWPGCWWNLNVELTISSLYTTNHIDIAHCVNNTLLKHMEDLFNNVPEKYRADCAALGRCTTSSLYAPVAEPGDLTAPNGEREAGNLVWTLFYIWQEYRITGDEKLLSSLVYPLLKRAVKYYSYFLIPDSEGTLHLKATLSPEYEKSDSCDTNYDLSLLRWGCIALKETVKILNVNDGDESIWDNILKNLIDYPQSDSEGLFIAAESPYARSHRHYSHLLSFYPLHILNENIPEERDLAERSLRFWQSKPEALLGYSQSGAASMYAMLGYGNKALSHLKNLWRGFILPNTMYKEGNNPVLETPPSAVTSIIEMLIQSHNGYIEVFPAVPDSWKNICFNGLLCYDGFEVGAELKDGFVEWVSITSKLGRPCILKAPFNDYLTAFNNVDIVSLGDNKFRVNIKKGETVVISRTDNPSVHSVDGNEYCNCYGLNDKNKCLSEFI